MKLSYLDRAIGFFSPATALRRGMQRDALERAQKRTYEGASQGRRTVPWATSSTSADAEIAKAGPRLRERMRELTRNNPHAAKAVSILANYIIGDGIMPRANTGDPEKNRRIDAVFADWARRVDIEGQQDFYGFQHLAVRSMVEGGEVIIRKRNRTRGTGGLLKVPLRLQMLEADHLDNAKDGIYEKEGARIIQGVEFNSAGARVAYWLLPYHPGAGYISVDDASPVRIPAPEICHLYEKQRTQVRGVPWGAPVMTTLRDLADYEDAELMRKKLEACFVGIVVNGDEDDSSAVGLNVPPSVYGDQFEPGVYDGTGARLERFEPGMFAYAKGGKDIKFNTPAQTGDYADYKTSLLHTVAAGFRVPYELLTTDLKGVSFISGRLGLMEFQRFISAVQWQIVIPLFLEPVWKWFCEAAYLAGELPDTDIPVEWSPPKWTTLDPLAEAKADLIAIRGGLRSLSEVIAERGRNPEDIVREIAEMNAKLDENEIVLDSDPRKTTAAGLYQVDPIELAETQAELKPDPAPAKRPAPKK